MGSSKNVLILCSDYMEDYEAAVPLYALSALNVRVHYTAPGKSLGDACVTAVHEFLGYDRYTELPSHRFTVSADFPADPASYNALVVPGRHSVEHLSSDAEAVSLIKAFAGDLRWLVLLTYDSQLLLAAAGAMGGIRYRTFFSMRPVVELAGGTWVEPYPWSICVSNGHVLTAIGWPAHAEIIRGSW